MFLRLTAAFLFVLSLHSQSFDAASVKPASIPVGGEGRNRSRIQYTPTSLTMLNVDVVSSVQWAYGVEYFQVSAPHIMTDAYDILAKTASPVPVSQLKLMLQELLAKRFKLGLHRETKDLPVYELIVAKGGSKLPPANDAASRPAIHAAESLPRIQGDAFVFQDASMSEFAAMLMQLRSVDLPVLDRTGIQGTFDIVLKSAPAVNREGDSAALFALIQDQLGLKLSAARAPIERIAIDHAEPPSGN
jgi:uncharacterized protein (TIGR03435 family)